VQKTIAMKTPCITLATVGSSFKTTITTVQNFFIDEKNIAASIAIFFLLALHGARTSTF